MKGDSQRALPGVRPGSGRWERYLPDCRGTGFGACRPTKGKPTKERPEQGISWGKGSENGPGCRLGTMTKRGGRWGARLDGRIRKGVQVNPLKEKIMHI